MRYMPQGDLTRTKTREPNDDWPEILEIVAYRDPSGKRKGPRKSIAITADMYFGRGSYGAPLSGEQLLQMVDTLRRK